LFSVISNLNLFVSLINSISHNYEISFERNHKGGVPLVVATVEYQSLCLLVDICSNTNVITSEFLPKLNNYKEISLILWHIKNIIFLKKIFISFIKKKKIVVKQTRTQILQCVPLSILWNPLTILPWILPLISLITLLRIIFL